MIPKYNFWRPAKILGQNIEIETWIVQSNQSENQKLIVKKLSCSIFFQEQVKFLKSSIWFQFYDASNKGTFFWLTLYLYIAIFELMRG